MPDPHTYRDVDTADVRIVAQKIRQAHEDGCAACTVRAPGVEVAADFTGGFTSGMIHVGITPSGHAPKMMAGAPITVHVLHHDAGMLEHHLRDCAQRLSRDGVRAIEAAGAVLNARPADAAD